jgi:hypothetical protein
MNQNNRTIYVGGDASPDIEIGTTNTDVTTISFWNRTLGQPLNIYA